MSQRAGLIGGLTWEELARERRPRRLRRGKHFRGDVRVLQKEATDAARQLGRGVRTVRDDFRKVAYLWVQFADHEVPLGQPCPGCNSLELVRSHEQFGHCPNCGASLTFSPAVSRRAEPVQPPQPTAVDRKVERKLLRSLSRRLETFEDVELIADPEHSDDRQEVWYGRGVCEGRRVVLRVVYPLRHGVRQPHPHAPEEDVYHVEYWPLDAYDRATDLGVLPR